VATKIAEMTGSMHEAAARPYRSIRVLPGRDMIPSDDRAPTVCAVPAAADAWEVHGLVC
jgi:hypothetical protein